MLKIAQIHQLHAYTIPFYSKFHLTSIWQAFDMGQLEHELTELDFQKYAINRFCSSRSHGITEEQIISLNNFVENNGYKANSYTSNTSRHEFGISEKL
jgi:hypothetical protein